MNQKYLSTLTLVIVGGFFIPCLLTGYVYGAEKSLEERIKALEATVKALDLKATRAQDVLDIQNLQGRYEAIHNAQEWLAYKLFANRPDTTFEITFAKHKGYETIKAGYLALKKDQGGGASPGGTPPGGAPGGGGMDTVQRIHPVGTPTIVVADDGKTAKGTFTSLGIEGNAWCYGKYTNSYIKIDGKWYIWHMKWNRMFMTDFYKCWSDQTLEEIYASFRERDEHGFPILPKGIDNRYLMVPGKKVPTLSAPQPYATWTEEDEDGGWYKRETVEP